MWGNISSYPTWAILWIWWLYFSSG